MKQIDDFKTLINQKKYYEAHEVLEALWFPIRKTKTDYCLILKGFINGAVSLELYKKGRYKQSRQIYKAYKKYTTKNMINSTNNPDIFLKLKIFMDRKFDEIFEAI
jgi:hypothetical protein